MAGQARLGFSVHTGWAALVAVDDQERVVARRRLDMIDDGDPERPRFVFHAARKLTLGEAECLVREAEARAQQNAFETLRLFAAEHAVGAAAILVGDRPLSATFEKILASHSLIHSAEGALYRRAIKLACEALEVRVVEIRARDLASAAAERLSVTPAKLARRLEDVGRAAGRPWAKDQKDAYLAALIA
jgi:hypothetical protein